jgi:hypothetical protein
MMPRRLILVFAGACLTACVPAPSAPVAPLSFSYTPPVNAPPGSANVTLAIVEPSWASPQQNQSLLEFGTHMKNDFLGLVTARGYTTRGPFASWQAMVYPDKTGSDLVLMPQLAIELSYSGLSSHIVTNLATLLSPGTTYTINGTATIRGQMNLVLTESMTNERMWVKSIPIDPIQVAWVGEKGAPWNTDVQGAPTNQAMNEFVQGDAGFARAVFPKLDEMYKKVLQSAWDYLDPREVQMVKAQAAKLKK